MLEDAELTTSGSTAERSSWRSRAEPQGEGRPWWSLSTWLPRRNFCAAREVRDRLDFHLGGCAENQTRKCRGLGNVPNSRHDALPWREHCPTLGGCDGRCVRRGRC